MSPSSHEELIELAARLRAVLVPFTRQLRRPDGRFTPTQLSVLGAVFRHGPISLGGLAAREGLSAPMISRVVAGLEDEGMVERRVDQHDRRVCRVQLSKVGQGWIDKGRAERNAWLADLLAALNPEELGVLAAAAPLLERLIEGDE